MSDPTDAPTPERPTVSRDVLWLGCYSGNHDWRLTGGCNAGCNDWCSCSVPVRKCAKCGDCDYGDSLEAAKVRQDCEATR